MTQIITDIRKHAHQEETIFLPQLRETVGPGRMAELGAVAMST